MYLSQINTANITFWTFTLKKKPNCRKLQLYLQLARIIENYICSAISKNQLRINFIYCANQNPWISKWSFIMNKIVLLLFVNHHQCLKSSLELKNKNKYILKHKKGNGTNNLNCLYCWFFLVLWYIKLRLRRS